MHITVNRCSDPAYEALFDEHIQEVYGFSFSPWLERKLWDERYESYSVIANGRILANVCIFKTDMLIGGQPVRAHQFGAVSTRASERNKGLSRRLLEHVLSIYPDTLAFMAANPSALDFYPRFGFRRVQTYRPEIAVSIDNSPDKAVRLDPDDSLVLGALHGPRVYSGLVDSMNTQSVQRFHLLLNHPEDICLLPNCGVIVIARQDGEKLYLADVIAPKPLAFDSLMRELPFCGVKRVEFGFCPNWLDVVPDWNPANMDEEPYFIRGNWNLPKRFRFPALSET